MRPVTEAPTPQDFLAAFGVDPEEATRGDGYWAYRFGGPAGLSLVVSFNTHESSVQTTWEHEGWAFDVVVHEGADRVWIRDEDGASAILASFVGGTTLEVAIHPQLAVRWTTLLA
jgi:hypothetical protein